LWIGVRGWGEAPLHEGMGEEPHFERSQHLIPIQSDIAPDMWT
jgi:hypothetical protein